MGSTFGSYSIASTGLYTSQQALQVTSHNISNINTEGYVRQQVMIEDNSPINVGEYEFGTGSGVQEITQIRDIFLDSLFRNENSELGYVKTKRTTIEDVENIFGELSSYDIQSSIDQIFMSWDELSKSPESLAQRAMVLESGVAFVETVNLIDEQLNQTQQDLIGQTVDVINQINSISKQIAESNTNIMVNEANGDNANDYRDERNLLIDQLSYLIDVDATEQSNGMVNITVSGTYLVNGDKTNEMKADFSYEYDNIVTVKWESTNNEVELDSGKLLGLIDSGMQNSSIISEVEEKMNTLVNTLATGINDIHSQGIGLDGSTDVDFFVSIDNSLPIGMGNIQANPELNDLNHIAASASESFGDNTVANEILEFRNEKCFNDEDLSMNVDDYYIYMTSWIGTMGQETIEFSDNQNTLVQYIQNQKTSISGVSMDEEMTNMIKYQQAYNASAKVLNTIDEMIDTIIHNMGTVGMN